MGSAAQQPPDGSSGSGRSGQPTPRLPPATSHSAGRRRQSSRQTLHCADNQTTARSRRSMRQGVPRCPAPETLRGRWTAEKCINLPPAPQGTGCVCFGWEWSPLRAGDFGFMRLLCRAALAPTLTQTIPCRPWEHCSQDRNTAGDYLSRPGRLKITAKRSPIPPPPSLAVLVSIRLP